MKSVIYNLFRKRTFKDVNSVAYLKTMCEDGNVVEIAKQVLDGMSANFMEDDGQCPLFWVLNCSNEVSRSLAIQYLLDAGADVNVQDLTGCTPLMKCANLGYADNMQQLLPRALLNVRDYEGQTALMHAIESKHQHCIDLLLRAGCDANVMTNHFSNALLTAAERGWVEGLQCLLTAPQPPLMCAVDSRHRSALHLSVLHGHIATSMYLLQQPNCLFDEKDIDGFSPLYLAGWEPQVDSGCMIDVLKKLTEMGADINISPPHQCALIVRVWDKPSYVRLLIQHGADVNISTGSHIGSLLEWAVLDMRLELANLLLKAGASGHTLHSRCQCALHKLRQAQLHQLQRSLPLTLKHLSRIAIRRSCHRPLLKTISLLPLPPALIIYLSITLD